MSDAAVARWEALTRRMLVVGIVYTMAVAVDTVAVLAQWVTVPVVIALPALVLLMVWGLVYGRWRAESAALAARTGSVPTHWSIMVQRVGVMGSIVAGFAVLLLLAAGLGPLPHPAVVALLAVQLAVCALVVVAARATRDQLRAAIAAADRLLSPQQAPRPLRGWGAVTTGDLVAGVLERLFPDRSSPAPVPHDGPAAPVVIDGRVADAAFWDEVLALVASSGGPLPLLESWGVTHRRWRLLSLSGTAVEASAGLLSGAVVTVYPDPPSPASESAFIRYIELVRAGPAVGLLEEAGNAMLRFDRLSSDEDLASWRRRASTTRRCGVYPAEPDAAALRATIVSTAPPANPPE